MKLYHGTSAIHLNEILTVGLVPRGDKNKNSNWDHTVASREGHVYLTTAYPFYFAAAAVEDIKKESGLIVEIDLPKSHEKLLYPDEDFIAQASHKGEGLLEATDAVDLEKVKKVWPMSLDMLGNASYKGTIPASLISRVVTIDLSQRVDLLMNFGDPCISLLNFKVMQGHYEGFVSWLMGDRHNLPSILGMDLKQMDAMGGHFKERADFTRKMAKDRHGIVVKETKNARRA